MLGEDEAALSVAAGAQTSPFTRKRNQLRMLAVGTICTGTSVCQNTAIEVFIKCLQHFTPQSSIVGLKQFFPLIFESLSVMIDYAV